MVAALDAAPDAGPVARRPLGQVDAAGLADFHEHHGEPHLPDVVVVIPAYQEAANIGAVLDALPATLAGGDVATVVVVDGGDDGTEAVARRHGAFVARCPVNRGQGAALRLGYELAARHGGRYLVTTDADGQYDAADLDGLVGPLVAGEADFVNGSRRLGFHERDDPVRRLGVVVFAALISALTHRRITDPANGCRAMLAGVPASVRLDEPQYQASELLVSVLMQGYRVVERPVTMRRRASGRTKKGNNLHYARQFARVALGTYLRER